MIRYQEIQQQEIGRTKKQFEQQQSEKAVMLQKLRTDKVFYQKMVKELEASARRLENLLSELRSKTAQFPEGYSGADFAGLRGKLTWPVAGGQVIYSPGKHKILDGQVEIYSHGIGIRSPMGADVYAVHEGLVRYAGWLEGSGNTIIIDHGQQYMTVYMHLGDIAVSKGQVVQRKGRIGSVGDSGSLEGPQLEFQIRKGSSTVNPSDWLVGR
jgi:septal ring factor EnvC (AmiA/AmiB activator)